MVSISTERREEKKNINVSFWRAQNCPYGSFNLEFHCTLSLFVSKTHQTYIVYID